MLPSKVSKNRFSETPVGLMRFHTILKWKLNLAKDDQVGKFNSPQRKSPAAKLRGFGINAWQGPAP